MVCLTQLWLLATVLVLLVIALLFPLKYRPVWMTDYMVTLPNGHHPTMETRQGPGDGRPGQVTEWRRVYYVGAYLWGPPGITSQLCH